MDIAFKRKTINYFQQLSSSSKIQKVHGFFYLLQVFLSLQFFSLFKSMEKLTNI